MLVNLRFQIGGRDIGEGQAGFIPDKGWTLQLEDVLVVPIDGVHPGLYRVVSHPHVIFASRGSHTIGRMRAGPVYVQVEPVPVDNHQPGLSSQAGMM